MQKAIQENELNNQIYLEEQRKNLVELQGQNIIDEAKYRANATKQELDVFGEIDPEKIRALALHELGKNADRIDTLTITPELLAGFSGLKN